DLTADLSGIEAEWQSRETSGSPKPRPLARWQAWLPHADLEVAQTLTSGSAEHESLWPKLQQAGTLVLRGQLDLREMLQPAIQPGSKLDYERPTEEVSVVFEAGAPFSSQSGGVSIN